MTREPLWRRYARFTRPDPAADVDDEIRFHMEELVRRYQSEGMDLASAQRAAREQFGDVERTRYALAARSSQAQRRAERTEWWLRFRNDVRLSLRKLAQQSGFATAVIATLALGIGANAGVFSVVNSALIRPLPYPEPGQIVELNEVSRGRLSAVSPPNFADWRAQAKSFSAIAAYNEYSRVLTGAGEPRPVPHATVTQDFLDAMGVQPARGRAFSADEFTSGRDNVVILSDALWRSTFGANTDVLGRTIQLDGRARTVVGIMPAGFDFPSASRMWTPLVFTADDLATQRGAHYIAVIARLKPGVPLGAGSAEITGIAQRLATQYPETNQGMSAAGRSLRDSLVGETPRRALLVLLGAVALVTLIACANVANLLLARGAARRSEMLLRASLGARPRDLIGMALTESVVLATLGGVAGLAVAWGSTRMLDSVRPANLRQLGAANLDLTVLAFTLGLSLITGLLFGLAPALQAVRATHGRGMLRVVGRGSTMGRDAWRVRSGLVAAELALAVILLAGAGLMIRSLHGLQRVDPGFTTTNLLTFNVSLPELRYPKPENAGVFFSSLREGARAIPGVNGVEAISGLPLTGYSYSISTHALDGRAIDPTRQPSTQIRVVTPGYFGALHMRIISGRAFTEADREGTMKAVILSASAARVLFGAKNPIGHSVEISGGLSLGRGRAGGEVVGVVDDVRDASLATAPRPTTYFVHAQFPTSDMSMVVSASARTDPTALVGPLRGVLRELDRDMPMSSVRTMDTIAQRSIAEQRFAMILLIAFALVAVLLAGVGIFGVISNVVGQRTREIGVRIALGARSRAVVLETIRRVVVPVGAGVGLGVAGALLLTSTMEHLLYGIEPTDPVTLASVAIVIAFVGLAAAWWPATRASRVDPVVALRAE